MKQYDFMKNPDENSGEQITVEHTPKRKLDLFPRIVCLLVAIGIWIFMVNVNDPNSVETMTLKLSIVGDLVAEDGTPLTVLSMDKTEVTIKVKGTNRDLKSFTTGDYRAVVDVSGVKKSGDITLPIKITTPANSSIKLDTQDVVDVTVSVDLLITKQIPLVVDFSADSLPLEGFEYGISVDVDGDDISEFENKFINISGPKSVVDRIISATYTVKHGEQTAKYSTIVPTYVTDSVDAIDTGRVTCPDITVTVKVFTPEGEESTSESECEIEFESESES